MVLLVPVFQAWPDGKAAGAALAEILSVPAESIGDVSSWDDLVKHQEAIQERVRFLRLKKLAAYYDSAAIRRAVKRNRDKYGERYAGAEGFLARLGGRRSWGRWTGGWSRPGRDRRPCCGRWWICGEKP